MWATTKSEICIEYKSVGEPDAYTLDELIEKYGTADQGFFCDWIIHGLDSNDFARLNGQLGNYALLLAEARRWVFYYYNILKRQSEQPNAAANATQN